MHKSFFQINSTTAFVFNSTSLELLFFLMLFILLIIYSQICIDRDFNIVFIHSQLIFGVAKLGAVLNGLVESSFNCSVKYTENIFLTCKRSIFA